MSLTIGIINYNTASVLDECLQNISKLKQQDTKGLIFDVIVVDNGSTDNSLEIVKKYSFVTLVSQNNLGLAVAGNKILKGSNSKYILYIGTDAFPTIDTIYGIYEYMEQHNDVGISTSQLHLRDGTKDMDAHRGFPTPWASFTHFSKLNKIFSKSKIFNQYFLGYKDMNTPHEIDVCISHFMFIRKEVLDKINGWDEEYFVFGEDVDMCYRVKQADYKVMYLPQYSTLHYKGVSVGRKETKDIKTASKSSNDTRLRMKKESTRAMKLFYTKHYSDKYPKIVKKLIFFGINLLENRRTKM